MIEFQEIILKNKQFINLCNQNFNCNSFLLESPDEVFLANFSYCFSKFLFCTAENKPCNMCLQCQKVELLSHSDLKIYPINHKNILVDDVKDMINNIYLSPIESTKKVFIFNNFSSATIQAQNKLLKILEEPPKNAFIILNCTNISKVLPTVLSRCKKIRLNPLSDEEIYSILNFCDESEKQAVISSARGQISKAIKYGKDKNFLELYNNCKDCIMNMKSSKELIKYSYSLSKSKNDIVTILEILESFYRDILLIRLKQEGLVRNKSIMEELKQISLEYDCDCIDRIIKKIYEVKKQLEFNCNAVFLIDGLLLYVLEVKFLCNKK